MRKLFPLLFLGLIISGCSYPVQISPATDSEAIPYPRFAAVDRDNDYQRPSFNNIKLYEISEQCEIPKCPLRWHVGLHKFGGPTKIFYGGFHGLGSMTLFPAQALEAEKTYSLVVSTADSDGDEAIQGFYRFQTNEDGKVVSTED